MVSNSSRIQHHPHHHPHHHQPRHLFLFYLRLSSFTSPSLPPSWSSRGTSPRVCVVCVCACPRSLRGNRWMHRLTDNHYCAGGRQTHTRRLLRTIVPDADHFVLCGDNYARSARWRRRTKARVCVCWAMSERVTSPPP